MIMLSIITLIINTYYDTDDGKEGETLSRYIIILIHTTDMTQMINYCKEGET